MFTTQLLVQQKGKKKTGNLCPRSYIQTFPNLDSPRKRFPSENYLCEFLFNFWFSSYSSSLPRPGVKAVEDSRLSSEDFFAEYEWGIRYNRLAAGDALATVVEDIKEIEGMNMAWEITVRVVSDWFWEERYIGNVPDDCKNDIDDRSLRLRRRPVVGLRGSQHLIFIL